jgi:hypothetical protein
VARVHECLLAVCQAMAADCGVSPFKSHANLAHIPTQPASY